MNKQNCLQILLTAACLFLAVAVPCLAENEAAAEKSESLEIRTYWLQDYDSDSRISYGTGHYQLIGLNGKARSRWPELAAVLEDFSRQEGSERTAAFEEACAVSRSARSENNHEYEASQETDIYPRRADDQVFSFITYYYGYTGGAHGYYAYYGHNYDPLTGQELNLADVVNDEEALKDVIWELLLEKYSGGSIGTMGRTLDEYGSDEGKQPLNWTAGADGLTFFFNPYELASYAEGAQCVTVGYKEYESLFTGRVTQQTGGGACRLVNWMEEEADLNGDGQPDTLSVNVNRDGTMQVESFTVRMNENECVVDMGGNAWTPCLMRADDGRTCLYLEIQMENDYRQTVVIDLTGDAPAVYGTLDAAFPEKWEDLVTMTLFPVDTDCFRMSERLNILSTFTGERDYSMAGGSFGEPLSDIWQVEYAPSLVVAKELPVYPIDEKSGSVSDTAVEVPVGEEVSVAATDGRTWADLALQDGKTARVYVDTSSRPFTIEGTDEADYFETLYYAG